MTAIDQTTEGSDHPHPIRAAARNFGWVHTMLGLIGNTAFLIGSILFFWESTKTIGIWLFVVGAAGMLIGSAGEALAGSSDD